VTATARGRKSLAAGFQGGLNLEEQFRELAGKVIKTLSERSGVELDYDGPSVEWVDGFIERQRAHFQGEEAGGLITSLGAFVGECIARNFGGRWRETEHGWGVTFGEGDTAYPFTKVRKQFANGREGGDSVHMFYDTIGVLFKRSSDDV
jgi:hypothetical protein